MPFIERLSIVYSQQDTNAATQSDSQRSERTFEGVRDPELQEYLTELNNRFNCGHLSLGTALVLIGRVRVLSQTHRELLKSQVLNRIIPIQSGRGSSEELVKIGPDGFFALATLQYLLYKRGAHVKVNGDRKIDVPGLYEQARELLGEKSPYISEEMVCKAKAAVKQGTETKDDRYWQGKVSIIQRVNQIRGFLAGGRNPDLEENLNKIPKIPTSSLIANDGYTDEELQSAFSDVSTFGGSDAVNRGMMQKQYPFDLVKMLLFCKAVADCTSDSFDPKIPSLTKKQLLAARDSAVQRIIELQKKGSDITSVSRLYYHDANQRCAEIEGKIQIPQKKK